MFLSQIRNKTRQEATLTDTIICGGLAGVAYQFYVYPIDVLKTNVQASKGTVRQLMKNKFWKAETFKIGFGVSLIRSFITDATNWTLYEKVRNLFRI